MDFHGCSMILPSDIARRQHRDRTDLVHELSFAVARMMTRFVANFQHHSLVRIHALQPMSSSDERQVLLTWLVENQNEHWISLGYSSSM